jgi:septum formation protein
MRTHKSLVIATASRSRRQLLENAGVTFEALATNVDEDAIKATALAKGLSVEATALALAEAKARAAQKMHPNSLIIGADQMLALGSERFDKPTSMSATRSQLQTFRGKRHTLHSAVVLLGSEGKIWSHVEPAHIDMRDFSDTFLDGYLAEVGEDAMRSVGGYFMEGIGVQLFDRVDGDFFTVLGLPLTPLLGALREAGVLDR